MDKDQTEVSAVAMITEICIFIRFKDSIAGRLPAVHHRHAQKTFSVGNDLVIEIIRDQCQVAPYYSGLVSPGFSQAVNSKVA